MASYTNKISRLLKAIEEQVQALLPTAVIAHAFTAVNADPLLSQNESLTVVINGRTHRIAGFPETAPASGLTDGLGLAQRVYVPTVLVSGVSLSAGGDASAGIPLERAVITTVVTSKNTRARLHEKAAIALADMVQGDASQVLDYNWCYDNAFGTMGNQ
jgi:hypothetical protein